MFALRLFGGLSLESPVVEVAPGAQQRRRLSLLALLALAGARGISRDRIQAHLWPESTPERARHALDQLLYATRRDLGADSVVSSASDLRLNASIIRVDIWEFDEAIRAEQWEEAAEWYVGPVMDGVHLVDGTEFERLLDGERMRREQDYYRALECLARGCATHADLAGALRWWRRRAAADPLSLPVALELMRALSAANERAAAIQHARVYQRLIRETLEIEPDAAIEQLAREIACSAQPIEQNADASGAGELPRPNVTDNGVHVGDPSASDAAGNVRVALSKRRWRAHAPTWLAVGAIVTVGLGSSIRTRLLAGTRAPRLAVAARESARSVDPRERSENRTASSGTQDLQARSLYLRGRTAWNKRTKEGLDSAVILFRSAIERDPLYAAAYTGLADAYALIGYFGYAPADAMFPKAKAAASRALELDSSAGEAYAALGQALAWQHQWTESENAYRRAIALVPNDATVHQWYALMLAYVGRAHEAAIHTGYASRLDPLSVQINNMHGMMLYYDGDLAGALRQYDRTVVDEPDSAWVRQNPWVLSNFARIAAVAGRHGQALRLAERALVVVPTNPRAVLDLASVYVRAGDTARARAAFARADVTHAHYAFYRAWLHALLGETDAAFTWLDKMDEWPLPALIALTNDPSFATVRADARYRRIEQGLRIAAR
jgi:serine/threonine-protein kinase